MTTALPIYSCEREDCTFPSGGSCARASEFEDPAQACPHLSSRTSPRVATRPSSPPPPEEETPWSGGAFIEGTSSTRVSLSRPHVVAVLGLPQAGKTTFLTALFLRLAQNAGDALPYRFAHSLSLLRFWELGRAANEWSRTRTGPVVPRTPRQDRAHFVHLGLCPSDRTDPRYLDLLLSDLDGETVRNHASHATSESRAVMGFTARADAVLLLVDAGALFGAGGDAIADDNVSVLKRLRSDRTSTRRRLAITLVLTKADLLPAGVGIPSPPLPLDAATWGRWGERLHGLLNLLKDFEAKGACVSIEAVSALPVVPPGPGTDVVAPLRTVLAQTDRLVSPGLAPRSPQGEVSSFLAMGASRHAP